MKCHAGVEFESGKPCPRCHAKLGEVCWPGINADLMEVVELRKENERLRAALIEIRDHWANQYNHPRKEAEMYRGPYGIGVTDGHRACAIIATKALPSDQRGTE